MTPKLTRRAALWAGAVILAVAGGVACSDLLKVENPQGIPLEDLNDVRLLNVQVAGVMDQFHDAYASPVIEYSNFLTDEILSGLNWEDYARASQRIASYLEGPTEPLYDGLQQGLRMGHDVAVRIRRWATEDPARDFRPDLAKVLVFAGYSATILAETMCQSVISPDPDNPSGVVLSQLETFNVALPYFTEALTAAQGSGQANLVNLAHAGLARAYMGLGRWTDAANEANQVTSTFKWWLDFVNIDGGRNPLENTAHGGNFTHGIHPWFTGLHPSFNGTGFNFTDDNIIAPQTDPRIQHYITDRTGHNALTRLYKLVQGLRYSGYTGNTIADSSAACPTCTGTPQTDTVGLKLIAKHDTDILLADYVEAQHQYYEALANQDIVANEAAVLAFVNARRAVGNQAAVTLAGQALKAELRNQRGRDLFMGGFRLGDLRRWTRFDPGNGPFAAGSYFPTGTHPNASWGAYGQWTCYPIPLSEYEGNPNLQRPVDPSVPPGI
jgi:hypothetical protein